MVGRSANDPSEPVAVRHRDWRLQALTTLTQPATLPSGITHPAGTVVESVGFLKHASRVHDLGLPSPLALYLGAAADAERRARRHLGRALRGLADHRTPFAGQLRRREQHLFDGLQERAVAIVFSLTALEAFANDAIPPDFLLQRANPKTGQPESLDAQTIGRFVSLDDKLTSVVSVVAGKHGLDTTSHWQHYRWLSALRDRLIHLKPRDWRGLAPEDSGRWIWTHVAASRTALAPWHVRNILLYFVEPAVPRWLQHFAVLYGPMFS
jgi:hypothetical protein